MKTVKDRVLLGMISGLAGNIVKTAVDEISLRMKISQRSFRSTASGVWVNKNSEATSFKGQLLGGIFDFGMAGLGGIVMVELLTRTGKDHVLAKGIVSGVTFGSWITALLTMGTVNKISPKDAASNLSYLASHAFYGIVATATAAKLGDPALFGICSHRKVPETPEALPVVNEGEALRLPLSQPTY